ncbi:hypothetical protein FisN_24Lh020 [Fistulifera solaris]|uniref:Frustulin-like protein n=1 Tax=Fistulifera solaris TaxID=1519565 RepID=W8VTA1_FISSO|nr:frustulin-like protein [Fistulifera solaris]GAX29568.1 hypothetical protein FisN_24Lh020 [Fistulifera solaris]|eukprot:GAX29568.1 hypothetical protein FisN_24Lh020 [Fistulifera solaris]
MTVLQLLLKVPLLLLVASTAANQHDEQPMQFLRRKLQVTARNFGRNHNGNLGLCEGHCVTNADCRSGFTCFKRDAGDDAPGCTLSDRLLASRVDFCVAGNPPDVTFPTPVAAPIQVPPTSSNGTTRASYVGNDNVSNLGLCQGDCDRDSDCAQGLKCHQRNRGQEAPGCTLNRSLMNSDNDFCVRNDSSNGGDGGGNGETPTPPAPVASPVRSPPSGGSFALKLYWEPGYDWQNEPFERKWCMSCRGRCSAGGEIAIFDCDDSPTQWEFVSHGPNEVQIKVANRNICVEEFPGNDLELADCDSSNQKQRFVAFGGSFNDRRFEISPKQRQGWCMTQRHHPKNNESVNVEPCVTARRDGSNTSYWNKY